MFKQLSLLLLVVRTILASGEQQVPFETFSENSHYQFQWPIRKVAVIGAGVSGLVTYRELSDAGLEVRLFERDDAAGGNWHFTEDLPKDAPVPNVDPVLGDYIPTSPPEGAELPYEVLHNDHGDSQTREHLERKVIDHQAPKPVWESLKSNTPAPYQQITELPWPQGTPWETPYYNVQRYLRAFASWHGINSNDDTPSISYNTRVEKISKRFNEDGKHHGWTLLLKKFVKNGDHEFKATWWKEDFDAVAIASGRFNTPYIPNIPGLADWKDRFPESIVHSREYRRPNRFAGESVLVVGASSSATEISRDINEVTTNSYLSIRGKTDETRHFPRSIFLSRVPSNTSIVGEIDTFLPLPSNASSIASGSIQLKNGSIITGIDRFIFGTGYRYSYPFLPQYHDSSLGQNDTAPKGQPQPIVTDGSHVRSLYLDIFYIEEPTLGFVNVNVGQQTFIYGEYLALALAKVWKGEAKLPSTPDLWKRYWRKVEERGGHKKRLQYLSAEENTANIRFFISWLNDAAIHYGGKFVEAPPDNSEILKLWFQARYGWNSDASPITSIRGDDARPLGVEDLGALLEDW